MRKPIFLVLAGLLILSSAGCIYTKIEQAGDVQISTQHKLTSSDFNILGRVSSTGETTLWFGAVLTEGIDTAALKKKTGVKRRNVENIIYRLKKQGKIKSDPKGIYVKA